jgi:hypothetical protein
MKPEAAPRPVRLRIASGAGLPDAIRMNTQVVDTSEAVARISARILGGR